MLKPRLALFSIILLALVLRILMLDKVPAILSPQEIDFANAIGLSHFGIFTIRLPGVLMSIASIIFFYILALSFFEKQNKNIAYVATFLLAVSPWHIQISRADFLSNLFILVTLALLIAAVKLTGKIRLAICLCLAVFVVFLGMRQDPSLVYKRIEAEKQSRDRISYSLFSPLSKILYENNMSQARITTGNAFSYFDPRALLFEWKNDAGRVSPHSGLFNPVDIILIPLGLFVLFQKRKKEFLILLLPAVIVFPLSATSGTPDAFGASVFFAAMAIASAQGAFVNKKTTIVVSCFGLLFFFWFLFNYFFIFPLDPGLEKEYVKSFLKTSDEKGKVVVVDKSYGRNMEKYADYYMGRKQNINFIFEVPLSFEKNTTYLLPRQAGDGKTVIKKLKLL